MADAFRLKRGEREFVARRAYSPGYYALYERGTLLCYMTHADIRNTLVRKGYKRMRLTPKGEA